MLSIKIEVVKYSLVTKSGYRLSVRNANTFGSTLLAVPASSLRRPVFCLFSCLLSIALGLRQPAFRLIFIGNSVFFRALYTSSYSYQSFTLDNSSTQSAKETIIMATQQPAQAFASHLINQTLSSIALLESLSLINSAGASLIRQKLPSPTGPFPSLSPPSPSSSFANLTIAQSSPTSSWTVQHARDDSSANSPSNNMQSSAPAPVLPPRQKFGPAERRAKALWDFNGTVSFQHASRIKRIDHANTEHLHTGNG